MTDGLWIPFLLWSDLLASAGGDCMARTRDGSWCKHHIFASMPRITYDKESGRISIAADAWVRWMDSLCTTDRRGRWLEAVRERRARWTTGPRG